MKAQTWHRLRQSVQVLSLLLFLYLFMSATFLEPQRGWSDLFYRLDPLVALTASLAGRALMAGLGLVGLSLAVTLAFGRVWCGWFCPFGTVLEWLTPKHGRSLTRVPPERWRVVKYALLFTLLFAALLANQTLLFLDPITIMTRTLASAVWPALRYGVYQAEAFFYGFEFLWEPLDVLHNGVIYPLFQDIEGTFVQAVPIFLFFIAIVALNWRAKRFWCRYLCPLGGLLGLMSKLALVRREVGDDCSACGLCSHDCPTGTIDPENGYRSDPAECTVCYNCIVGCSRESVAFRWQLPHWKAAARQMYDPRPLDD